MTEDQNRDKRAWADRLRRVKHRLGPALQKSQPVLRDVGLAMFGLSLGILVLVAVLALFAAVAGGSILGVVALVRSVPVRYYVAAGTVALVTVLIMAICRTSHIELRSQTLGYKDKMMICVVALYLAEERKIGLAKFFGLDGEDHQAISPSTESTVVVPYSDAAGANGADPFKPDLIVGLVACVALYFAVGYLYNFVRDLLGLGKSSEDKGKRVFFVWSLIVGAPKTAYEVVLPVLAALFVAISYPNDIKHAWERVTGFVETRLSDKAIAPARTFYDKQKYATDMNKYLDAYIRHLEEIRKEATEQFSDNATKGESSP